MERQVHVLSCAFAAKNIHFIIKVISQKVKLGQQLETWQIDMQKVLEEQIELKLAKKF